MKKVRVVGLLVLLMGATFFVSTVEVVAQSNHSNSGRLQRERDRDAMKKKERKLREDKLLLDQKALTLKEKEKAIDNKVSEQYETLQMTNEKQAYDALIRRYVIGTVLERTSDWLIIEDEKGNILCFVIERLNTNMPKTALIGQVLSTQKGDLVQLTTFTQTHPIVSALQPVKKRK